MTVDGQVSKAVELLKAGEVVAIPTETVYGLAGIISNEQALNKIFTTKNRPFFDPLIVHVSDSAMAKSLVTEWTEAAEILTQKYWPGPLTIVLDKNSKVSDLVTSGLDSVALRMPKHELALEIIKLVGEPVAAPSANKFGKTSPTTAEHVTKEFDGGVFVVDGGECEVGIESTIVKLYADGVELLRPGQISFAEIKDVLSELKLSYSEKLSGEQAPGQVDHHYMPEQAVVMINQPANCDLVRKVNQSLDKSYASYSELNLGEDPILAARKLYSELRQLAQDPNKFIVFVRQPKHDSVEWQAIMNRLDRAASLELT